MISLMGFRNMKRLNLKFISIVTLICIFTVLLCACNAKQTEKGSGGNEQIGSKTESKTEEDTELDVDDKADENENEEADVDQKVPSDSYSELFEQEKSTDKNTVKNNSENKEEKQEVTTESSGDGMSPEPDNPAMEKVTDTETQYGAISGSNP